jgi:hypothetical protein
VPAARHTAYNAGLPSKGVQVSKHTKACSRAVYDCLQLYMCSGRHRPDVLQLHAQCNCCSCSNHLHPPPPHPTCAVVEVLPRLLVAAMFPSSQPGSATSSRCRAPDASGLALPTTCTTRESNSKTNGVSTGSRYCTDHSSCSSVLLFLKTSLAHAPQLWLGRVPPVACVLAAHYRGQQPHSSIRLLLPLTCKVFTGRYPVPGSVCASCWCRA